MRIQGKPVIEIPTRNMKTIIRTARTHLIISALSSVWRKFFRRQSPPIAPLVRAHRTVATSIMFRLPNFNSKMEL